MAKHKLNQDQSKISKEEELIHDTDETWNDTSDDGHFHQLAIDPPQLIINSPKSQTKLTNTIIHQSPNIQTPQETSANRSIATPPSPTNTTLSSARNQERQSPIQSTSSPPHRIPLHPSVAVDIFDLIKDPAYVLTRLKTPQDTSQSITELAIGIKSPAANPEGALPWETVIPSELITKQTSRPSSSRTPPSNSTTDLPSVPYRLLPSKTEQKEDCNHQENRKEGKFIHCLEDATIDVTELRKLSWSGIPFRLRSFVWQVLLGYLPAPKSRRIEILARKRQEYLDAVRLAFGNQNQRLDQSIWHQIQIDVARTNPGIPLWQYPATRRSLERILYVWAIRHPASGYVQGINDLVTPFFQVFLTSYIDNSSIEVEKYDVSNLPIEALEAIEADSFWSLSKLLEGIQDNYIFAQPGIQRQVARLKELCERVDARLHKHLEDEKVEFIQFAFRWINCLLMRELNMKKIIRMWDTYLAEGTAAFSEFHLYVCLAFLVKYSDQLRAMDFQSIIMFLQALPTQELDEKDLEFLLSQAFMWHSLFQGATGHFVRK